MGALMLTLDVHHPDILEFIEIKQKDNSITKANISVRMSKEFFEAVRNKTDYELRWNGQCFGTLDANMVFDKIVKSNSDWAEPGILYWDRVGDWNLLSNTEDYKIVSTNPCGEQPLPGGASCLLGALNLAEFVSTGYKKYFNFNEFAQAVQIAVGGLNEVLDEGMVKLPLKEQQKTVADWLQIGCGIMGLADMLIKLEIQYGSPESLDLCDKIGQVMIKSAFIASCKIGQQKGGYKGFNIEEVKNTKFFKTNLQDFQNYSFKLRNSSLLTVAPTGSLATMLGISGGVEPVYANYYTRKTESLHGEDKYYKIFTPIVERYFEDNGLEKKEELLPKYFVTAQTLDSLDRIKMQAVWQKHIDSAISSTVNLPKETAEREIHDIYLAGYDRGLKGLTIFRDGCKRTGILTTAETEVEKKVKVKECSSEVIGLKRTLQSGCGSLHCSAFFEKETGEFVEIYLSKGSTGGCNNFMIGLSRLISLAARAGVGLEDIVDQLKSCGTCPSYAVRSATKKDTSPGASCPIAVANALLEMEKEMKEIIRRETITKRYEEGEEQIEEIGEATGYSCPICGATLKFEGGCNSCSECGYSKCE